MVLKAIETRYKGYRFRSRLEARWAVFFDVLGVEYDYEPEGFHLGDGRLYLPDFWLKSVNMWAEVKPTAFDAEARSKCEALVAGTGFPCLLLDGAPFYHEYSAVAVYDSNLVLMTYVMDEDYLFSEHRFFGAPECCPRDVVCCRAEFFPKTVEAYEAARSARFEHGEHGAPQIAKRNGNRTIRVEL